MYQDYSHSLLSMTASLQKYFGFETPRSTLPELDALLASRPRNVVLLLFDGLGTELIKRHRDRLPFLNSFLQASICSVFPPTTTAATTSVETGLAPIEHGWLGWSLYFEQLDKNVNLYPNTSGGKPAADYHVARRYLPFRTIVERLRCEGEVEAACISPYSDDPAPNIPTLIDKTRNFIINTPGRHYVYGYSPLPDYDMHDLGTNHPKVLDELKTIDAEVKRLCASVRDTLVLVTADHGMIDTEWRFMDEHPELCECLVRPPSIEGRAMSLFVKEGKREYFAKRFRELYGDIYELTEHDEVMRRELFGDGIAHPRAESFIGDFLAVAKTKVSLAYEYDAHPFAAAHAGVTDSERYVPLCAIRCK